MSSARTEPGPSVPSTLGAMAPRIRGLGSFRGSYRTLHLTWFAFFLTFVVWFNFAPFSQTVGEQLHLTKAQLTTIALCNVALTVPARIVIGMLLDRLGPRRVYAAILIFAAVPSLAFALSSSFPALVLSRLALSIVGAGFVVGIRMVSEWFPPREIGMAEGVYGGFGNFGAAAAAALLPMIAGWVGGPSGWRWAIASTGILSAAYGLYYLRAVTDTPEGRAYARPRRQGALEVTSRPAVFGLAALTVPLAAVLVLIAWRIRMVGGISAGAMWAGVAFAVALLLVQLRLVFRVNRPALAGRYGPEDSYPFRSVAILCLAYFCSFGSELAVVSMLPTFFAQTWGLGPAVAGAVASAYAFMNLGARPAGGLLSDVRGSRRRTLRTLLGGVVAGYAAMALLRGSWPVVLAMLVGMLCSGFVSATNGAVYAIVPLVKKRVSGQIAGLVGAYGNVGAIVFLTALLFLPTWAFFALIAGASLVATTACRLLPEPKAGFSETLVSDTAGADLPAKNLAQDVDLDIDVLTIFQEEPARSVD
jgi:MFS transporter, NNP family, nitrate/nitrite transporter